MDGVIIAMNINKAEPIITKLTIAKSIVTKVIKLIINKTSMTMLYITNPIITKSPGKAISYSSGFIIGSNVLDLPLDFLNCLTALIASLQK